MVTSSLLIKVVVCVLALALPTCASAGTKAALSELSSFRMSAICESYFCVPPLFESFHYQFGRTHPQKQPAGARVQTDCYQKSDLTRGLYLNLVIELRSDRSFKVVKASKIAGQLTLSDYPVSNFVYEVTTDHATLVIGFFREDPFTVRGFADRDNAKETSAEGKSATVVINVPLTDATSAAISKLHVRIIKLVSEAGTEITSTVLNQLLEQKKALLLYDLRADKLGPAIRKKLVKLRD